MSDIPISSPPTIKILIPTTGVDGETDTVVISIALQDLPVSVEVSGVTGPPDTIKVSGGGG
jgi:hypothetical protein